MDMNRFISPEQRYSPTNEEHGVYMDKVTHLRTQIEHMEQSRKEMANEYERQLNLLRTEVGSMRRDYERLQRKYSKQTREGSQQKDSSATIEIAQLYEQMKVYQKRITELENHKILVERQVESLQADNKSLVDKCGFLQEQNGSYQSQLERRREMLDTSQSSLRQQISDLESQLVRAKETNNSQASQLGRLKSSLDDALAVQAQTLEDKQALEKTLTESQQSVRVLQPELTQCKEELQSKSNLYNEAKDERDDLRVKVKQLTESLKARDLSLQQMTENSRQELSTKVQQLMGEIDLLRNSLRKHKSNEKSLLEESSILQDQLDASRQENAMLARQLGAKRNELKKLQSDEIKRLQNEIIKLKESSREEQHMYEDKVESVRQEVSDLTAELHQKNVAMATLTESKAKADRQVRDQQEALERREAEMHVANAQLEALRLENRQLRKSALETKMENTEANTDSEKSLKELQQAYSETISTLEKQNERLQAEVQRLHSQLQRAEANTQEQINTALRQSEDTVRRVQLEEQRRTNETKENCEKKVEELQQRLRESSAEYEQKMQRLRADLTMQEEQINSYNKHLQRLGQENMAMSNFVNGIDTIVQPPRIHGQHHQGQHHQGQHHQCQNHYGNTQSSQQRPQYRQPLSLNLYGLGGEEDDVDQVVNSAGAKFLATQELYTRELEKKLDSHIAELERAATDHSLYRY